MGHAYLMTFPVSEKEEARTLGSSSAWDIIDELREAGLDGLTAHEISKKLDLAYATVYSVLSKLQAAKWVESRRSKKQIGRPDKTRRREIARTGRMKQIYIEKIPWGYVEVEDEFQETLNDILPDVLKNHQLVDTFADALDNILGKLRNSEHGTDFFPSQNLCPKCHKSHEAEEFLYAICFYLTPILLDKFSDKLKPVLKKHGVKGAFEEAPVKIA